MSFIKFAVSTVIFLSSTTIFAAPLISAKEAALPAASGTLAAIRE